MAPPQPGNPQSLNRYAYVLGNQLRYTDPSGHATCADERCACIVHPATGQIRQQMPTYLPPESPQIYDPFEAYHEAMGLL